MFGPGVSTKPSATAPKAARLAGWIIEPPGVAPDRGRRHRASAVLCKSVGAPAFAADAMMNVEEAVGIVFLLDGAEPRVMAAPIGLLPIRLEEIALPYIGGGAWNELAQFAHRLGDGSGVASRRGCIGLVSGDARIGGLLVRAADRQRESVDHGRVHRRILRRIDRLGRSAGEPFVEVKGDAPMLGRRKQRVDEALPPVVVKQGGGQPQRLIGV